MGSGLGDFASGCPGEYYGDAGSQDTAREKVSYGIGVDVARNFTGLGTEFDADILMRGFKDEFSG